LDSFEDLGLSPELAEALASEGIEIPTPLQEEAVPVLRRGNNLVLAAGPGSGVTVTWGAALLDRIEVGETSPQAIVLAPSSERADHLAETVGRLGASTGHSVAALGSHWVLPGHATVLFGTPAEVLAAAKNGVIKLEAVEALVMEQMTRMETFGGLDDVERVLEYLPKECQRVVTSLPVTEGVTAFTDTHVKRAMTLPAEDPATVDGPQRGTLRFRIAPEPREAAALELVDALLAGDHNHVLVFCRSEDRAADVGDYLTLHGYVAGAPGDTAVPVWLGVDALEAREAVQGVEGVAVLSCDVPADGDTLDRRHALAETNMVVVLAREVAHLRATARLTGYTVIPSPPAESASKGAVTQMQDMLRQALDSEDTAPYLLALEPLFAEFDPAEVAAAAVALLRKKSTSGSTTAPSAAPAARAPGAQPAWAKLFLGVGERDGVSTGDLLGAITGEANVPGEAVGRIDIKESHTLVEVHDDMAPQVIKALNGTTISGRAVRADFDRPKRGGGGSRKGPPER
jgi:ATP-dependent RNA helicase DeaD